MTVSAIRGRALRPTDFPRTRRSRRFWDSMAGALREIDRRPGVSVNQARDLRADRAALADFGYRMPAAA